MIRHNVVESYVDYNRNTPAFRPSLSGNQIRHNLQRVFLACAIALTIVLLWAGIGRRRGRLLGVDRIGLHTLFHLRFSPLRGDAACRGFPHSLCRWPLSPSASLMRQLKWLAMPLPTNWVMLSWMPLVQSPASCSDICQRAFSARKRRTCTHRRRAGPDRRKRLIPDHKRVK